MPTAQVLMDRALRGLGAIGVGASASGAMQTECLAMLNALIDRERTSGLNVPQILQVEKTLTAGTGAYTVGASQNIDIARPIDIEGTSFLRFSGQDYPLEKLTRQQYNEINDKSGAGMPDCVFYDDRFPIGYVYLHPVPDQAYVLHLDYQSPLGAFATASTDIALPPAAESFLWTNLALDLWPLYPNQRVLQMIVRAAANSRTAFNVSNVRVPVLKHTWGRYA